MVPCNMDRGNCFPWLEDSRRTRKLIVTVSRRFRASSSSVQSSGEVTEGAEAAGESPARLLTRNGSLWVKEVNLLNIGVGTSCLVSFERELSV